MEEQNINIDPVSGNPVPPGARPEEVRDDVPIMASEGEYVIPANVVRYLGLDRIEKMVKQAKKALQELDAEGRIGGATEDDLPFSMEDLQAVDEGEASMEPASQEAIPQMAEGGLVTPNMNNLEIDPTTGLPLWLVQMQQQQAAPAQAPAPQATPRPTGMSTGTTGSSDRSQAEKDAMKPTGLARPVSQWSADDYGKYANYRNSPEAGMFKAATSLIPFGGVLSSFAQRATERSVNRNLTEMIQSGRDLNGNPLSTEQLGKLRETFTKISTEPMSRVGGISAAAKAIMEEVGIKDPKTATPEQIAKYNERVQGDSLVNKVVDFVTGANRPAATPQGQAARTTPTTSSGSTSRNVGSIGTKTSSSGQERGSDKMRVNPSGKTGGSASVSFSKGNQLSSSSAKNKTTSTPSKTTATSKTSQAGRAGFAKGGLIKQRNK